MNNLLFLDVETTGFNQAKIVQLAYSLGEENMIVSGLWKPDKEIDQGASDVHGFTNEMLKNMPIFLGSTDWIKLQTLLSERIMICHNVKFDKGVLENESMVIGKHLCTIVLAKLLFPNLLNHKLQTLREHFKIELPEAVAHSASGDVMVLKAVFLKLLEKANQVHPGKGLEWMLSKAGYYSY